MVPEPNRFAVRTGGGRSARLAALAFVGVVGLVVGLGWFGHDAGVGQGDADPPPATGATPSAGEPTAAVDDPFEGADGTVPAGVRWPIPVVGSVAVYDPQPDTEIPASVRLGVSGRVMTYRPAEVVVRLRIAGRRDIVDRFRTGPDGTYAGWLEVPDPAPAPVALLDVSDGANALARTRPLATIRFRIGAPGPITIDRPVVPLAEITTPNLVVEGTTDPGVGSVTLQLEARNNRVIEHRTVPTEAAPGTDRRTYRAAFELPAVHPNGTMVVEVAPADGLADPERYRLRIAVVIGALQP